MMISEAWIDVNESLILMKKFLQPRSWHLKKQMDPRQTECTKSSQLELQDFDIDSLSSCEIAPETEDALLQHKSEKEVFGTIINSISISSPCNISNKEDICLSSLGSNVNVLRPNVAKGLNKDLFTLTEGKALAEATLKSMGFKPSPSQPITPGDGNCFLRALVDQLSYDRFLANSFTHESLRAYVVTNSDMIIKVS